MSQHLPKAMAMTPTNLRGFMFENDKIEDITNILNNGGIILHPTDTIWGIGCDATNPQAIQKIYALKKRALSNPLSIIVSSIDMVKEYVEELHPKIETLLLHHTRPLTLIYPIARNLPPELIPEDGSIAIRIVQDDFCRYLIEQFGKPLVSTSANVSGDPFPPNFGAISSAIIQGVDYVSKERQADKNMPEPSVIARVSESGELTFVRL